MNEKKFAFITCVNDEQYYEECRWFLEQLQVPDGYECEYIAIRDAASMAEGYNRAMHQSDAKYKVYLHQDVFVYHRKFLQDILELFQTNPRLGMLGVIGGTALAEDAVCWDSWNAGRTALCNCNEAVMVRLQETGEGYTEAAALDGMLLATQYDLEWREDLTLGWDFYDISQSLEYRRRGYSIGIPHQRKAWCLHDCGAVNLSSYEVGRRKVLEEYRDYFTMSYEAIPYAEAHELAMKATNLAKRLLEEDQMDAAARLVQKCSNRIATKDFDYARSIYAIWEIEQEEGIYPYSFAGRGLSFEEMKERYNTVKFLLRRIDYVHDAEDVRRLDEYCSKQEISKAALNSIIKGNLVSRDCLTSEREGKRLHAD